MHHPLLSLGSSIGSEHRLRAGVGGSKPPRDKGGVIADCATRFLQTGKRNEQLGHHRF